MVTAGSVLGEIMDDREARRAHEHHQRVRRVIGVLSRRGILVGTAETAALPALVAATAPDVESGSFHGPRGLGHVGGRPGPQQLYAPLRDDAEARWVWTTSVDLIGAERLGLAAS